MENKKTYKKILSLMTVSISWGISFYLLIIIPLSIYFVTKSFPIYIWVIMGLMGISSGLLSMCYSKILKDLKYNEYKEFKNKKIFDIATAFGLGPFFFIGTIAFIYLFIKFKKNRHF